MTTHPLTKSNTTIEPSFISLNALNPESLANFYVEHIGLSRIENDTDSLWISLGVKEDVELIRLYPTETPKEKRTTGLYHLALLLPSRQALANQLKHFIQKRTPLTGASNHGYSEAIYLDDPEGNGIEIYADRDRANWKINDNGTIPGIVEPMDAEAVLALADEAPFEGMPPETFMGHFHTHVNNLNEIMQFYHEILGLGIKYVMNGAAAFMATGDSHHQQGANLWQGENIPPAKDGAQGLRTLVWQGSSEDLGTVKSRLEENHYPFIEDEEYITFKDPAGIQLALKK